MDEAALEVGPVVQCIGLPLQGLGLLGRLCAVVVVAAQTAGDNRPGDGLASRTAHGLIYAFYPRAKTYRASDRQMTVEAGVLHGRSSLARARDPGGSEAAGAWQVQGADL